MLTTISVLASATCAAALVTGSRVFGLRKIVKHSTKTDVAFTAGAGFLLAGTLSGLATAIVAGLMMALVLSILKFFINLYDNVVNGLREVRKPTIPEWADPTEYDSNGQWVYNQAPYVS